MLGDMRVDLPIDIFTDASAAKGIASRRGLGRTRHIAVHFLWVQERVAKGDIRLHKVWGEENPADLLTKYLTREKIERCMNLFNLKFLDGRAESLPTLASLTFHGIMPVQRW